MTKSTIAAARLAMIAGMASIPFAGPAVAQQGPVPNEWIKLCQKQKETDVCNVQFIKASTESGQLLTALNLIEIKGKQNRRVLQITVPPMRILPPGIGLQVDGGKTQKVDYVICPVQENPSCIAEAPLTDELINSFKRGSELTITAVNFQNQPTPVKISLQGFTGVYDGEPMKQSEFDDRRKQIQAEVEKRRAEFEKKLKEEQEKAKAN